MIKIALSYIPEQSILIFYAQIFRNSLKKQCRIMVEMFLGTNLNIKKNSISTHFYPTETRLAFWYKHKQTNDHKFIIHLSIISNPSRQSVSWFFQLS